MGDFKKSLIDISNYLVTESEEYDDVLDKYEGVNKGLLNQMIFSNFSEINYYRRKNGVQLDDERLYILNSVEKPDSPNGAYMLLLYCDVQQFATMINDVLLYFWHPSPMALVNTLNVIF